MLWYLTHLWLISPVGGKSCPRPHWGLLWEDSFFRDYNREAPGDTGKHTVALMKLNSINVFVIVTCLYLGGSGVTAIQIARRQCGKLSGPLYPPRILMCLGATFEMVLFWILSLCFKHRDKQTSHLCFPPSLESRQGCPEWISHVRNRRSMKW